MGNWNCGFKSNALKNIERIKEEERKLIMKRILFVLLFTFVLSGCSDLKNNENFEEMTENSALQESIQDDMKDENTDHTKEAEVITTEMVLTTEEIIVSEEVSTEMYTTEQLEDEDSDYYAICSSYNKDEVEMFAQIIKDDILNKDWEELAGKIAYPITIGNVDCSNEEDFKRISFDDILTDDFYTALKDESCEAMFCNYAGIMLGNGQVWIGEVIGEVGEKGELMVIAINP